MVGDGSINVERYFVGMGYAGYLGENGATVYEFADARLFKTTDEAKAIAAAIPKAKVYRARVRYVISDGMGYLSEVK